MSGEEKLPAAMSADVGAEGHERRLAALDGFIAAYEAEHSEIIAAQIDAAAGRLRQRGDCGIGPEAPPRRAPRR